MAIDSLQLQNGLVYGVGSSYPPPGFYYDQEEEETPPFIPGSPGAPGPAGPALVQTISFPSTGYTVQPSDINSVMSLNNIAGGNITLYMPASGPVVSYSFYVTSGLWNLIAPIGTTIFGPTTGYYIFPGQGQYIVADPGTQTFRIFPNTFFQADFTSITVDGFTGLASTVNNGTVTSITAGAGLTGGTITTTGTIALASATIGQTTPIFYPDYPDEPGENIQPFVPAANPVPPGPATIGQTTPIFYPDYPDEPGENIQPFVPAANPDHNAFYLQGYSIQSGPPAANNLIIYNSAAHQWQYHGATGDATYTLSSGYTVVGIQGTPVVNTVPTDAQILVYSHAFVEWIPVSVSGDATITSTGAVTVSGIQGVVPDFAQIRLTLTQGTPVTTSDVTGATHVYMEPYGGNCLNLYNGSIWIPYTVAASTYSVALGTLTSGRPYDVFAYYSSGIQLGLVQWASAAARNTALTLQDGILVLTGTLTWRYLGTIQTTSTTATEDSALKRYLWNYYNRKQKPCYQTDSTTHTYTTGAWRAWDNGAANYQCFFVLGLVEDATSWMINVIGSVPNVADDAYFGVGLNASNSPFTQGLINLTTSQQVTVGGTTLVNAGIGANYVAVTEYAATSATYNQFNLYGSIWC